MSAPIGGHWLVTPVASAPQYTGADFTEEDLLYAKTAEDFVRHEVLGRLADRGETRRRHAGAPEACRGTRAPHDRHSGAVWRARAAQDDLDARLRARCPVRVL